MPSTLKPANFGENKGIKCTRTGTPVVFANYWCQPQIARLNELLSLQECPAQDDHRDGEIDDESGDVHDGRHEWRRRSRRIEPEPA
jgi:hypothetical protein